MFISPDMSKEELLAAIDSEPELHNSFYNEHSFIVGSMTEQEIYEFIQAWVEEGDETYHG
jgi:hypothetical protein